MSQEQKYAPLAELLAQDLTGRIVLLRVDYNLPLTEKNAIADDTRLKESLPTLKALLDKGAKVLTLAHLGKPHGDDAHFSLKPVALHFQNLLSAKVNFRFLSQPITKLTRQDLEALPAGTVALAENLRFTDHEKANDPDFAKHLAALGDFYVLDAFSVCHRRHASIASVAQHLPSFAGLALVDEIKALQTLLGTSDEATSPIKNSLALVGGAKISTKLPVLKALLCRFERVAVGGGIANTLLAAQGYVLGGSFKENSALTEAKELLDIAGNRLLLPTDLMVAEKTPAGWSNPQLVSVPQGVPQGKAALDLGTKTLATYSQAIQQATHIVWNGPLGLFEDPPFDKATLALTQALATSPAQVVAGGGETLLAIQRANANPKDFAHLSTGGGAFLAWLQGQPLPGLTALQDSHDKHNKNREYGGPTGAEPTRYGDWEHKGRAIDF